MGWRHWIEHAKACKKGLALVAAGLTVVLAGVATSLPATAGIADSKHNLGTTPAAGVTRNNVFGGTAEICVFCHTPHGADTSAAVPLWNRTLPAASNFTTYDSLGTSSLDGKTAPVGSVSIACLSCHDGTTAMNSVINAPGSGLAGDSAWTTGTWTTGTGKVTGVAALGVDLRDDHPIGIQYAGGGYSTIAITGIAASTSGGNDPDFKKAASQSIGSTRVWWVDTEATANGTRQKTDMALYTRGTASNPGYTGQANPEPFVECASCHDPHVATNGTFLRISNAGSAVCLACHVK
jgi:predicted CXXCH cytochrome family protein